MYAINKILKSIVIQRAQRERDLSSIKFNLFTFLVMIIDILGLIFTFLLFDIHFCSIFFFCDSSFEFVSSGEIKFSC